MDVWARKGIHIHCLYFVLYFVTAPSVVSIAALWHAFSLSSERTLPSAVIVSEGYSGQKQQNGKVGALFNEHHFSSPQKVTPPPPPPPLLQFPLFMRTMCFFLAYQGEGGMFSGSKQEVVTTHPYGETWQI